MSEYPHADLTGAIIGAAVEVHRALGPGYLESIYEKALTHELELRSIPFQRQLSVPVHYKDELVGEHRLDLMVDGTVVVELKSVSTLIDIHTSIVVSYLVSAGLTVGLILNFGQPRLDIERIVR